MIMTGEPNVGDARAALSAAEEARAAMVSGTRRPVWIDAITASGTGAFCGLMVRHSVGEMIAAGVIACATLVAMTLAERRAPRRGRILDERALGAHIRRFAVFYISFVLISRLRPPDDWWPWYSIGAALLIAALGFAWLRLDQRYQSRRLAAGDYGRYDLV